MSAVLWTLYKSALIKRELRVNSKLLIYFLIYVPALTYDRELWVEIERTDASSRNELPLKEGWAQPLHQNKSIDVVWTSE